MQPSGCEFTHEAAAGNPLRSVSLATRSQSRSKTEERSVAEVADLGPVLQVQKQSARSDIPRAYVLLRLV